MTILHAKVTLALTVAILLVTHVTARNTHGASHPESLQQPIPEPSQSSASQPRASLELPITFDRRLGDLSRMAKRHQIRALVVPSHSGFFYDKGQPRGIYYEALDEFQRFVNTRLRTGSLKINVTFIPVRPE